MSPAVRWYCYEDDSSYDLEKDDHAVVVKKKEKVFFYTYIKNSPISSRSVK